MIRPLTFGRPGIHDPTDHPFHLSVAARPLTITLHEESFIGLSPVEQSALRLLVELGTLDDLPTVSTHANSGFPHIQVEHKPDYDAVVVRVRAGQEEQVGDIRFWSHWQRMLHNLGIADSEMRTSLNDVLAATAHVALNRDILVTGSDLLLRLSREQSFERWNCLPPTKAVELCGLYLRAKGDTLVYRAETGFRESMTLGTSYILLARSLMPESWRYTSACVSTSEDLPRVQAMGLASSVMQRFETVLTALDHIAVLYYAPETGSGHGTLNRMLYHLQLAVVSLAGAFEAQAQLCRLVYPELRSLGPKDCSFRYMKRRAGSKPREFELRLPEDLRRYVADPQFQAFLDIIWAPRNLIQHREAPSGITFSKGLHPRHIGKLLALPEGDTDSEGAVHAMKENPEKWGLHVVHNMVGIEPYAFLSQLVESAAKALDDIMRLTDVELIAENGQPILRQPPPDELFAVKTRNRVRLLAGLPPETNEI